MMGYTHNAHSVVQRYRGGGLLESWGLKVFTGSCSLQTFPAASLNSSAFGGPPDPQALILSHTAAELFLIKSISGYELIFMHLNRKEER